MRKINVLMLVPNLRVANGVASFVMNYFLNLNQDEVHMDFALYSDRETPYYKTIKHYGGKIYILPNIKKLTAHIKECNKILSDGQYDIIHDNTLHVSIPMMWCAKHKNIPVRILHSHNSKMGENYVKEIRNRLLLPFLRKLATNYMACSKLAGDAMFKNKEYVIASNVIVLHKYCYDEQSRYRIRKKMKVEEKVVVGTVGRLAEQKNPYFAIKVFEKFSEIYTNAEYWWIGSGSMDDQVKKYIHTRGIDNKVKLLGSTNEVIELYQAMDCFFLPSLFEGLPVTGVEAQAMGLPMVVSDLVTDEMVYTDLVDFVSLNDSIDVWVEHLERAITKKINRRMYNEKLKQSVFSDIDCGQKLINMYQKMLKRGI